jgi:hypothetical protein
VEGQKQAWRREVAEKHKHVGEVLAAAGDSLVPSMHRTDGRRAQMQ